MENIFSIKLELKHLIPKKAHKIKEVEEVTEKNGIREKRRKNLESTMAMGCPTRLTLPLTCTNNLFLLFTIFRKLKKKKILTKVFYNYK